MSGRTPLRIGYLGDNYPPEVGALAARASEMAAVWTSAGERVTVVTALPNRLAAEIHEEYRGRWFLKEEREGVRVLRSWLYASETHSVARTLVKNLTLVASGVAHALARAGRLDVLIASSPPFFMHAGGDLLRRFTRVPLVLELRDLWPDYMESLGVLKPGLLLRTLFAMERYLLSRADHVVVVTESFKRRVVEKGVAAERVSVLPNGVDTDAYRRTDEPPPLPELRRGEGELLVGYVGNFGVGQEIRTLLRTAEILAARAPDVRFVIAGGGSERPRVEALHREMGLPNTALLPPIPRSATRAFYNACDVSLIPLAPVPIFAETIPSKIFEVMACESPVAASVAGEAARIVREAGAGEVSPPGEAGALADAIIRLRDAGPERRREMGRRARAFVLEHYDRTVIAHAYLECLHRVAAARGRARGRARVEVGLPSNGTTP